jgi:hypothetical protein
MPDAPPPVTPADIAQKQDQLKKLEIEAEKLDAQLAAMSDDNKKRLDTLRTTFIDDNQKRFPNIDVRAALLGGKAEHAIVLMGATYFVAVPNSKMEQMVDTFVGEVATNPDKRRLVGSISGGEVMLLQWLSGVQFSATTARAPMPPSMEQKLEQLRALPAITVKRLAEECGLLQSYLNTVLEMNLGKS